MDWKFWKPKIKVVEVDRQLGEVELASRLADLMGDIDSVEIAKEGTKEIFAQLANVDGLMDFLRDTMVNDIKRYFSAQTDRERDIVRGGFYRTAYIRSQVLDSMKNS